MPSAGPDRDAVVRFEDGLDRVARASHKPLDLHGRFGLAVSGGPDSLALLLLARAHFPGRIEAATFDHGFRPESAAEAEAVAAICAELDVPHTILLPGCELSEADKADTERRGRGGLQALARTWRYRVLGRWCRDRGLGWLLTAHHADDQAETVLMRLARGSGPRGLSGIRPALPIDHAFALGARDTMHVGQAMVGRPLLGFTKAELAALVTDGGLRAAIDPSNADPRFDRTRARALLGTTDWLDPHRLSAVADIMRDVAEAQRWAVMQAWQQRAGGRTEHWHFDPEGLPEAIVRGLCQEAIERIDDVASPGSATIFRGAELTRFIARLRQGGSATLSFTKARGGARWHFVPAPPRREPPRSSFALAIRLTLDPPSVTIGGPRERT